MSNAVVTMQDVQTMAVAVAKSGLFGVKTADQALALMLIAQAEGRHPALAARDYDIIQGRPAKKTEAMLRDFLEQGGSVKWNQLDDTVADATFSHPAGGTVQITWDMKRAKAAGLAGRDMWAKYPRQMLRSRVVSEGIRTVCPMATSGMYVPEEVRDMQKEKVIAPTTGALDQLTNEQADRVVAVADKVRGWLNDGAASDAAAELDSAGLDADEMVYFWTLFDAKQGKVIANGLKAIRAAASTTNAAPPPVESEPGTSSGPVAAGAAPLGKADDAITEKQHKRIESRITEVGAKRDDVKAYVLKTFRREHFTHMSQDEYDKLDAMLDRKAAKAAPKGDDGGIIGMDDDLPFKASAI